MEVDSADSNQPDAKPAPTKKPICLIVLGMAGSGKTSFVNRLSTFTDPERKPYVVNLDPACRNLPYAAKIDIRDTVNYKEVMKQYKLGPNGAIVTSLNLFATKFGDVINFIGKTNEKYCVLDTPGQIEVFTWSVSGTIITESLASSYPTVIVYVMDTVRSINPVTFMSNMLYACSILYKTKLPFIVVMNKTDVVENSYAVQWMNDFEAFQAALDAEDREDNAGYMNKLVHSMSMALDKFYEGLRCCGVSSLTGDGFDEFFNLLTGAVDEYETDYRVEWERIKQEKQTTEAIAKQKHLERLAGKPTSGDPFVSESWGSNVYLRHPGNESSEDEEGEEQGPLDTEHTEELAFKDFVENRTNQNKRKATGNRDVPGPSRNT